MSARVTAMPGRQKRVDRRQVGLVDIGSNSVRFVVYDGIVRAPMPKFNEKVMCGLGRGLKVDGNLGDGEMRQALAALERYFALARAMGLETLDVFATEAVRAAANGPAFVAEIEARFATRVAVLTGDDEGRFAALGVASHFPDADGVVGDLGGASLELAEIGAGEVGRATSFPFGPFRVMGEAGSRKAQGIAIEERLAAEFASGRAERTFYAVGGAWRAFAKLAMARLDHRFHIVDGYALDGATALQLAALASRRSQLAAADLAHVSKRRQETLPAAALVLAATLRALRPARVVFSASGVREGRLFAHLDAATRARDPLLEMAERYGSVEARFGGVGRELVRWTAALFPDETRRARRLRIAACHLSDVAWSTHPDYRAGYALDRVLHLPLPGLDHAARAWLGLAVHARYRGGLDAPQAQEARALAGLEGEAALVLGHALQLAYRLSGATAHLLAASRIERDADCVRLILPDDGSLPLGDAVERRLATLAKALPVERFEISHAPRDGGQRRRAGAS